jgi:small GTP-binding protein
MNVQRKICLLGAYAVGKTSLIRRYVQSMFDERYLTTVGVRVDKKVVALGEHEMTLMIWDLAGQDDVTTVDMKRCRGAGGLVLVADGCRAHTLDTALQLSRDADEVVDPSTPRVLAVNKVDLEEEWEVARAQLAMLGSEGWTVFATSAKSGEGVEDLFQHLGRRMLPVDG